MKAFDHVYRFFLRFRYPVSIPEDVALALGINLSSFLTFNEFVKRLTCPSCRPTRLKKFMSRQTAEEAFKGAVRKEHFQQNSLFSYYFNEGWLEFVLQFDTNSRLRRIYIHHRQIQHDQGLEIPLAQEEKFEMASSL